MNVVRKVYNWMESTVDSPYSTWWLALLFFTEAIFFIPVDPLLIFFVFQTINDLYTMPLLLH